MKMHRLTEAGLEAMAVWLDDLRRGLVLPVPNELLSYSEFTQQVESDKEVGARRFGSRFQFAAYIDEKLSGDLEIDLGSDRGFWSWLTLVYFDELTPADASGKRRPGHQARYILEPSDYRTYYRHLLAGPWRIYRAHRDDPSRVMAVLCGPLAVPGEVVEQLASRQELVSSAVVMETATKLYFENSKGTLRRGAANIRNGGARRLADVLSQFDLTYDFPTLGSEELLKLLPSEFAKFKPKSG